MIADEDFLKALLTEQSKLIERLDQIRALIRTYNPSMQITLLGSSARRSSPTGKESKEHKIRRLAIACIEKNGGRAKTEEIQQYLETNETPIQIQKPNLSAYLSRFKDEIASDRSNKEWKLRDLA